ncbi:hypothetical protein J4N42_19010 [Vibrio sp. SCSIO 43135]|uniref:DUF6602 domain-containing protein n=1 Tax=Vibrio sp. SCSIO 43135 TaxID=2819096 RepID=UPI002074E2FF|nr:DUF6602 domain-containing protein [Vibrio sp. SCSIO 43135]USD42720.1 hypothetical protein J4N42_19010 [Vibrio sp. SCSIO 43135]
MNTEQYFKSISMELKALENRIRYLIHETHWLTDGEWKESILRQVIQRSCPQNISVGRGFVLTDAGNSRQIDILLYDNTQPVIYSDGDLVFIQPSSCRGIIEVKSTYSSEVYRDACKSISETAKIVRDSQPGIDIFVGVFIYEMQGTEPRVVLDVLKELTDQHHHKTIDHICLGQNKFVKFWEQCPRTRTDDYNHWHQYRLCDMSFGYFIHNLLSVISGHRLVRNEMIWFPVQGKENNIENSVRRT